MTFFDFLKENNIVLEKSDFDWGCYVFLVRNGIPASVRINGYRHLQFGQDGKDEKEATENLVEAIKGLTLDFKGWDSNENYVYDKIKVPKDLEVE